MPSYSGTSSSDTITGIAGNDTLHSRFHPSRLILGQSHDQITGSIQVWTDARSYLTHMAG
jgi:hypothetical protein